MTLRLRGTTTVSALLFVAFATLADTQSPSSSPIAKALEESVHYKTVKTKLPLICDYWVYRSGVDDLATEFYEDGTVQHHFLHWQKDHVEFNRTYELKDNSKVLQPGSEVYVMNIRYLPDRIVLDVNPPLVNGKFENGRGPGAIVLVLSNGYEAWQVERIVNFLYKIISIPAIDERIALENQYRTMVSQLKSNVVSVQPANPPVPLDAQIEDKTALYQEYRSIADIAAKLRNMHDPVISSDSIDYEALAEGAENQLVTLREAADADRKQKAEQKRIQAIQVIQQKEAEDEADLQKVFLQLDKSEARSEAESNKCTEALKSAQGMADDWLRCVNVLALANLDLSADRKRLEAANQHIQRLQAALDASSARIHSQGIDAKYQLMVLRLAQLKSAYGAAFGTPGADAAKANLKTLLSQMIVNRESAAAAGSAAAEKQAQQLRVELGRLR